MKLTIVLAVMLSLSLRLMAGPATPPASPAAADKSPKKLTCCQEAKAKGKECTHSCCIAAHKRGESCKKCNPNKEDLAKKDEKAVKPELAKPTPPAPKESPKVEPRPKKTPSS